MPRACSRVRSAAGTRLFALCATNPCRRPGWRRSGRAVRAASCATSTARRTSRGTPTPTAQETGSASDRRNAGSRDRAGWRGNDRTPGCRRARERQRRCARPGPTAGGAAPAARVVTPAAADEVIEQFDVDLMRAPGQLDVVGAGRLLVPDHQLAQRRRAAELGVIAAIRAGAGRGAPRPRPNPGPPARRAGCALAAAGPHPANRATPAPKAGTGHVDQQFQ